MKVSHCCSNNLSNGTFDRVDSGKTTRVTDNLVSLIAFPRTNIFRPWKVFLKVLSFRLNLHTLDKNTESSTHRLAMLLNVPHQWLRSILQNQTDLHLNHSHISCGERWKRGPLLPFSILPCLPQSLLFSSASSSPSCFLSCLLLPLFFTLFLLWSYPEQNKPALSQLLSGAWPSAPCRMFFWPWNKVFLNLGAQTLTNRPMMRVQPIKSAFKGSVLVLFVEVEGILSNKFQTAWTNPSNYFNWLALRGEKEQQFSLAERVND